MPYTVELFSEKKKESLWRVVGSCDSYGAAAELFDETCARNEHCPVLLRGEMGEVVAKRSVSPVEREGVSDGS